MKRLDRKQFNQELELKNKARRLTHTACEARDVNINCQMYQLKITLCYLYCDKL